MNVPIDTNNLSELRVESSTIHHSGEIESDWCELQERSDCSFFQSWSWIGTWVDQIASDQKLLVVKVWSSDVLVGLGLFVEKNIRRRLFIHSNALFLNELPFDGKNMVIEYNGLLADRKYKCAVFVETINHLVKTQPQCDEFYFGAISDTSCLKELPEAISELVNTDIELEAPTWIVDLRSIEGGRDSYLASLSKNTRWQIKRSLRIYEEKAQLKIVEASDLNDALQFFDGLKDLHTQRWNAIGLPGSFANPDWEAFHRNLIRHSFSKGEIQLLKVSGADGALGYLYNFIWRKRVYMVQSGFVLPEDNRLMPGYMIHVLAVEFNKNKGMHEYDFMYGDSRYKTSLSDHQEKLTWLAFKRHRFKFTLENHFVRMGRAVKSAFSRKVSNASWYEKKSPGLDIKLRLEVIREFNELKNFRAQWNGLLSTRDEKPLPLTHEWMVAWWKNFGENRQLSIYCVYEGKRLVAIAPFMRDEISYRGIPTTVLRLMASGHSPFCDVLLDGSLNEEQISKITAQLIDANTEEVMVFAKIPETSLIYISEERRGGKECRYR